MAGKENETVSKAEHTRRLRQIDDLTLCVVKTRDQLRVVIRALEEIEYGAALDEGDSSMLDGAVGILDEIAENCDRVFKSVAQ